ncbi:MDR family MFS transporter [Corynebacterium oculi]|uniref:Putative multidrug resistance protein EmrY n=1 Tax=Corynebacterium oculi TaxID=1544416 RepID=A0A0Q1A8R9_9CORY|nr:MDR family MFS transporter [Corynebacterium oculi]KQB83174.1 putative multidrug resistance protein EmrY [Corynebacterium oculi]
MPYNEPSAPRNSSSEDVKIPGSVIVVLVVLVFAAMMMFLNETILSVALPAIMADFGIEAEEAQWLTTGFMLTMAIVIPTTGYLLQRWSTRTIFLAALASFLTGTVVAASAPVFGVLLAGRVLQAVGTALIMPLLMTVAMTVVPAQRRGTVMGTISIVMAVAPALGPTVSGLILESYTWHWLFWVMVPLVAVVLVCGLIFLRNIGETATTPLDVFSVLLSAVAFGSLIYALSSLGELFDPQSTLRGRVITLAVVGIAALVAFVLRQRALIPSGRALLDLRVFTLRDFTIPVSVLLMVFGALLGAVTILPLYLQTSLDFSERTTGLILLPGGLLNGLLSPFVGRIFDRVGPRPLLFPGLLLLVGSLAAMSTLDESSTLLTVMIMHMCFSVSLGLSITPLMTTALGSLPAHLYGHGSASLNTVQQLAGAMGTALLIMMLGRGTKTAMASGETVEVATAHGTHWAFLLGTGFAVVALVLSFFVRRVPTSAQGASAH